MDNGVNIYDINNSFALRSVDSTIVKALKVDFNPSGTTLLCGTTSICLVGSNDGILLKEFATNSRFITCLRYSPNGKLIASGNVDGALIFYNDENYTRAAKMEDHGLTVRDVGFTPESNMAISVSDDMHINITDT